jgi:hypothetical protein
MNSHSGGAGAYSTFRGHWDELSVSFFHARALEFRIHAEGCSMCKDPRSTKQRSWCEDSGRTQKHGGQEESDSKCYMKRGLVRRDMLSTKEGDSVTGNRVTLCLQC